MITLSKVNKNYGFEAVLENFSMTINSGEKVGLIGANGSGKSTVFKLLAGIESPDQGMIAISQGLKVGYMNQMIDYKEQETVEERLLVNFDYLQQLEERLRELEVTMKNLTNNQLEKKLKEYSKLSTKYEVSGGYTYQSQIDQVVQGLGLDSLKGNLISELSGGERARVQIAELLLTEPDILLLDEPTNHLDFKAINWLEEYINNYSGTVIIISHDRYFLDKTIDRIIEIKHGQAEEYAGNYSYYLTERKKRYQLALKQYNNQQKEIKRKEETIKQLRNWGKQSDNEKFYKRAASMEKQLAKIDKLDNPDLGDSDFNLDFAADRSGQEVVVLDQVSKTFGDKLLFKNIDLKIFYGQKVGLIGPNGSGKTTLLRLLLDEEVADKGNIKLGANVKIGYLSQHQELENQDLTLLEAFRADAPPMYESKARTILASYGFKGDNVFRYIKELSGGERVRFHLLKMMHSEINFLILDEPTNHLDIKSIEILEETLADYQGTLLVVSHDRYFLNKTIDSLYVVETKDVKHYAGNYDYYQQKIKLEKARQFREKENSKKNSNKKVQIKSQTSSSNSLKKKLEAIESQILELEVKLEENNQLMMEPQNLNDYEYLNQLKDDNENIHLKLEALINSWEDISLEIEKV
ncbi:ATP-binding cassette subfamily F protein 3 [Orenia metallireducens]|uniref:ribosomal protection-like ABC-F family protein n=1 Tax=Orenia metallireducens TaxID=1413210 RepID=UPI000D074DE9|nr:ABC-F family ATP-binding cassette domain-containing protein [Orenia metallireducens]PRX29316.1 ATP-binding cassette subfamily F protein 3 [Orenia metallireducens]